MQKETFFTRFDEIISEPKQFALVCHVNPDGDAIGSVLGLSEFLRAKGHKVDMLSPNGFPGFLMWMPGASDILMFDKQEEACKLAIAAADCIIMLDFNALARSGVLHNEIGRTRCPRILIDHHRNPELEQFYCAYSETGVSSASELVTEVVLHYGMEYLTESIATNLLVGIMTDTGAFSHSIYHPRTFELCSILSGKSADYSYIHQMVYSTFSENRLRLLGHAISNKMEILGDLAVAIITLSKADLECFDYQIGDTEGVVNFPLSIKRIKMAVLITERSDQIRLSFRSKGDFSVHDLAHKHFKGGGHTNAAGGNTNTTLEATVKHLKEVLQEYPELRYES